MDEPRDSGAASRPRRLGDRRRAGVSSTEAWRDERPARPRWVQACSVARNGLRSVSSGEPGPGWPGTLDRTAGARRRGRSRWLTRCEISRRAPATAASVASCCVSSGEGVGEPPVVAARLRAEVTPARRSSAPCSGRSSSGVVSWVSAGVRAMRGTASAVMGGGAANAACRPGAGAGSSCAGWRHGGVDGVTRPSSGGCDIDRSGRHGGRCRVRSNRTWGHDGRGWRPPRPDRRPGRRRG